MTTMAFSSGIVSASAQASGPEPPASPTLTNPDMILPDYDHSSPGDLDGAMQASLLMYPQAGHAPGNNIYSNSFQQYQASSGVAPTTPIIYGNGTMLSDIGEVTEAESTPAKPSPPRQRYGPATTTALGLKADDSEGDAALGSSPTIGKGTGGGLGALRRRAKAAQRERRNSSDSNSTITDHHDHAPVVVEFDDTVSVGDSVFQGDDEESLASSYADDTSLSQGLPLSSPAFSRDSRQKYTTSQLSRRAEQILANAKKRLTLMEDNLTRARSSLVVPSYSDSNTSTPSPPITRASTALIMSTAGLPSPAGHRRMSSDNSLRIGLPVKVYPQRSSTSLGVANGPRQQALTISKSADQLNGQYNRQRVSYIMRDASLEPLGEDDASQPAKPTGLGITHAYSSNTSPPATRGPNDRGLSRSASTSQMRDIQDQVNDLKGKISSLREQARADSIKRRSLQGVRTPSPFTYAPTNPWYATSTGDPEPQSRANNADVSPLSDEAPARHTLPPGGHSGTPLQGELDDDISPVSAAVTAERLGTESAHHSDFHQVGAVHYETHVGIEDNTDMLTENGDAEEERSESEYEEAVAQDDDRVSDDGDSIYHESVQHPISHEDREDAFDYEHFFLHSAMGTMSQRMGRRGSDTSFGSEDSVETTRGPVADGNPSLAARARRGSETSVSTIDTFATAEERSGSRQAQGLHDADEEHEEVENDEEEEDKDEEGGDEEERDAEQADQAGQETFPSLHLGKDAVERRDTPPPISDGATSSSTESPSVKVLQAEQRSSRPDALYSAIRRPMSSTASTRPHAPSVSSFESSGTTRSFPLVNRNSKSSSSRISTPESGPLDLEAKSGSNPVLSGQGLQNNSVTNGEHKHRPPLHNLSSPTSIIEQSGTTAVIETLHRDDQFLVERLVASLGRCVLGITENSRASTDARMYRRRIDAARKILEGLESP